MAAKQQDLGRKCAAILDALAGGPHTTLQLHRVCGVMSVSARVHELRAMGHEIATSLITVRNRHGERCHVAEYTLRKPVRKRAARKGRAPARKRA